MEETPAYRTIPLTQSQFAIVDAEDYDWLMQWKWHAWWSPAMASYYARRTKPSIDGKPKHQTAVMMHREILSAPKGVWVDHRNHDTLDNRRENVRLCTPSQNGHNKRRAKNNTSGFKGVSFSRHAGRWMAYAMVFKVRVHLGLFDTPEAAHAAREKYVKAIHGEFYCPE